MTHPRHRHTTGLMTACIPCLPQHRRADDLAGAVGWEFFDRGAYVGLTLAMITVFFVISVGIPV